MINSRDKALEDLLSAARTLKGRDAEEAVQRLIILVNEIDTLEAEEKNQKETVALPPEPPVPEAEGTILGDLDGVLQGRLPTSGRTMVWAMVVLSITMLGWLSPFIER